LGVDFLTLQSIIWGNYSLSIGALGLCIFVGWKWGIPAALASLEASGDKLRGHGLWSVLVRFVCPLAVLAILVYIIITQQYF
jgi:SNF family Na+-dependent transporter